MNKGLNRFVWNMRHATMPGVPNVYIESSYAGHKASPGKYTVTIIAGDKKISGEAEILANPMYPVDAATYQEYHRIMQGMEAELTTMHKMINNLNSKREQLEALLKSLPAGEKFDGIRKEGDALVKKMKTWDEEMIQRKSKAYDDVENFPNKFTANYMFLINQTESDIPRVNQPNIDLMNKLNAEWAVLKQRGSEMLNTNLPALNKMLWDAGIGAVWK
jgi:hypothetical protein